MGLREKVSDLKTKVNNTYALQIRASTYALHIRARTYPLQIRACEKLRQAVENLPVVHLY